jgi:hypothetical protein
MPLSNSFALLIHCHDRSLMQLIFLLKCADSPTGSSTVSVFNVINPRCLSDCRFSLKLLTRRAELPMQVHSKHGLRKQVYAASFNNIFPFVGQHPATIRKSLKSQLDASSL